MRIKYSGLGSKLSREIISLNLAVNKEPSRDDTRRFGS